MPIHRWVDVELRNLWANGWVENLVKWPEPGFSRVRCCSPRSTTPGQAMDGIPYAFVDGLWLKALLDCEVKNVSALVAIGVAQNGYREILESE